MRRIWRAMLVVLFMLCLAACGGEAEEMVPSLPAPSPLASGAAELPPNGEDADPLAHAIRDTIAEENQGSYLPGECQGVGYKIMETCEEGDILSVYALTEYVEYGFQDGVLVNISGTGAKVLMRFQVTDGVYEPVFYTRLDTLSELSEEELERLVQPLKDTGKEYLFSDQDLAEVRAQADGQAAEYLRSIGREAQVGPRQSHEGRRLSELISDQELLRELSHDEALSRYPDWQGTSERLEAGKRYIYQTAFDEERQELTYTKLDYETNDVVESTVIGVQTGR